MDIRCEPFSTNGSSKVVSIRIGDHLVMNLEVLNMRFCEHNGCAGHPSPSDKDAAEMFNRHVAMECEIALEEYGRLRALDIRLKQIGIDTSDPAKLGWGALASAAAESYRADRDNHTYFLTAQTGARIGFVRDVRRLFGVWYGDVTLNDGTVLMGRELNQGTPPFRMVTMEPSSMEPSEEFKAVAAKRVEDIGKSLDRMIANAAAQIPELTVFKVPGNHRSPVKIMNGLGQFIPPETAQVQDIPITGQHGQRIGTVKNCGWTTRGLMGEIHLDEAAKIQRPVGTRVLPNPLTLAGEVGDRYVLEATKRFAEQFTCGEVALGMTTEKQQAEADADHDNQVKASNATIARLDPNAWTDVNDGLITEAVKTKRAQVLGATGTITAEFDCDMPNPVKTWRDRAIEDPML